jgi:hypothetical protein
MRPKVARRVPIKEIEARHPRIPALFTVAQILITSCNLFIVSLLLLRGFGFLPDTRSWMVFAAIFLGLITASVLMELHWRAAGPALFAFSSGTTLVFLWILLKGGLTAYSLFLAVILTTLLAISMASLLLLSLRRRSRSTLPIFLTTIVFWLCVAAFLT